MLVSENDIYDLIGVPFKKGGRGQDGYDCYGLVRELFRRDGKDVPDYASPEGNAEVMAAILSGVQSWTKTEPKPGVMVLFSLPLTMHCGYVLPNNKMAHCWKWSSGVCIEPLSVWQRRVVGYYDYTR